MDQPTKAISSHDPPGRRQENGHAGLERRFLLQGAVRAVAVVVVDILGPYRTQLPTAQDQHPIQQLPPDGAHPTLRVGVRPRCPQRRAQHPDPLGREDRLERGSELRVPVAEQQPEAPTRCPEELPPGQRRPLGRRFDAGPMQDGPDGAGPDPEAQAAQLTVDTR
jgi:hypothetical protein